MIEIKITCDKCGEEIKVKKILGHDYGGFVVVLENGRYLHDFRKVLCSKCVNKLLNKVFE